MSVTAPEVTEISEGLTDTLSEVEGRVGTSLGDLLRLGSQQVSQINNAWGDGTHTACALTATMVGFKSKGL